MTEEISSNKRIAKNTLIMYGRMLFMMFIGLFTSRVILNALGVSDLGLMSVAGSVIGMLTFLNGTLTSGTQRFITYAIGEGNMQKLKNTFSTAMTLHVILAVIITILLETFGLWYVYNELNIEPGRFEAAMWCYQLGVLGTFISIILVPFNSALAAHEAFSMVAYMSIYDAVAKLLAAYLIQIVEFDRVIFYSILIFIIGFIPTFIYNWYCRKHFEECSFRLGYDKSLFRNMISFSGWNTIGCLAAMGQGTGVNLVLNSFCGTMVNGARGIAFQANGWVNKFVESFTSVMAPQITKSYAAGDYDRTTSLVCNGASFACYLYLFLGIPLFIEIEWVLNLWLGQCPDYTVAFFRIVMIETLFRTMGNPTITAMHATGQMKTVNITVGFILLVIVPMSYLLFRFGASPEVVVAANVIPWIIVPPVRVIWVRKYSNGRFPISRYVFQVLLKVPCLAVLMGAVPFYVHYQMGDDLGIAGLSRFIAVGFTSVISSSLIIFYLGMNKPLRNKVVGKVIDFYNLRFGRKNVV